MKNIFKKIGVASLTLITIIGILGCTNPVKN